MIGRLRYRHKIAAIIFVFALLPMLVLGPIMIGKVWSGKADDIVTNNNIRLTSSVNGINNLLSSNMDKVLALNNNFYIYNYLETNSDQNLVGVMNFSDYLQSVVNAMKSDNPQIDFLIYALKDTNYDGDYLRSISNLERVVEPGGASLQEEILQADSAKILWKYRTVKDRSGKDADYLFGYKKLMSLNQPLAIIEVRIPVEQILRFFAYEIPKGGYIVYDAGGKETLIKGGDADRSAGERDASGYYAIRHELKPGVGQISMFLPKRLVFQELKGYLATVLVGFVLIIGVLFVVVEMVSHFLTKKFETLFRRMNTNVESLINSDSFLRFEETDDEFGKMGQVFYELTLRIKAYYRQIADYELEKTVLETQLLQERFNPHFLYNTLSTFRWIYNDPKVHEVVDSMVKYYRIALNKGSSIITIEQETEMIREYLRLQKFAYGSEFEFAIELEGDAGRQPMLKNLLQPIVENAFLHGVHGREAGGMIRIRVARQAQPKSIRFEISDNGRGMGPEKIAQILGGTSEAKYTGYGMKNVLKRMETYYGDESRLTIESEPGFGTKVVLEIPGHLDAALRDMKSAASL